jgi:hypothetical protein
MAIYFHLHGKFDGLVDTVQLVYGARSHTKKKHNYLEVLHKEISNHRQKWQTNSHIIFFLFRTDPKTEDWRTVSIVKESQDILTEVLNK